MTYSWKTEMATGKFQRPMSHLCFFYSSLLKKKKKTLFPSRRPQDAAIPFLKRKGSHELTYFLFTMSPNFLLGQLLSAYMFPGHSVHASIKSLAIWHHNLSILCTPVLLKDRLSFIYLCNINTYLSAWHIPNPE